jgi:hypothetical protein
MQDVSKGEVSMTVGLLLITCLALSPWMIQFFRYVAKRPEAIPTPSWMVTTNVLFVFLMPLLSGLIWRESFTGHERAATWIAFTSISYWVTLTAIYQMLSLRSRTVEPDGPRGYQTAFGTLKSVVLSVGLSGALKVYIPLVLLRLFFIRGWGLGVSGGGRAMMDLPYYLVVLYLLLPAATGAFTTVFSHQFFSRPAINSKVLCAGALATNFVLASLVGRRPVLMFFGFFTLGMMWSGRRQKILPIVGLGLAVWFILTVFSPVFLRARNLWRLPNGPDVATAFKIAVAEIGSADSAEKLESQSKDNVSARVNTYRMWLEFYDRFMDQPLGGLALAQAVLMNLPRFLVGVQKYAYGPTVEFLYGSRDISNNVCLESFIDLGPLGPFVYGAGLAVLFFMVDVLVRRVALLNKYAALVAAGPMLEYLVSPEAGLIGYVSALRHTILVAVLAFLLALVFGRRPVSLISPVNWGARQIFSTTRARARA